MILYQVISTYQLLNAIVHKTKYNSDKKCVLIISSWLTDKHQNYEELEDVFDKVIVMNAFMKIEDSYIEKNNDYCTSLLKKNGLNINDFSEIHAMGCHYNFGAFLASNNIPHYFWEDAAGLLSRPEILININKNGFPIINEFCEKMCLYNGGEAGVVKKYCNFSAQAEDFDLSDAVNFDVISEFLSLDEDKRLEIRGFFTDAETIEIDENSVLILTQQLFSLGVLGFEEQALIYQLFVDYFFPNEKIVFKTHPDDFMYYGLLFKDAEIIRKKFPAEFLPSLFTNNPKTIATISSTAIDNLKKHYDSCFVLGTRFEREFHSVHKYALIMDFAKSHLSDYQLVNIGGIENVILAFGCLDGSSDKRFYFIDKAKDEDVDIISLIENAGENDVFAFVNSDEDFAFYDTKHKDFWNYLYPVALNKEIIRSDDVYTNDTAETVYFITKNEVIAQAIESISYTRSLKNAGICVSAAAYIGFEKKISLLKALALASENKLLETETALKAALLEENSKDKKKNKKKKNKKKATTDSSFEANEIYNIRYSDPSISIEDLDDNQKELRILEGIINSTERRLLFYMQNGENL